MDTTKSRFFLTMLTANALRFWHGFGLVNNGLNRRNEKESSRRPRRKGIMLKKKTILLTMLATTTLTAMSAATPYPTVDGDGNGMSLDSCISYALAHSNDIGRCRIEHEQSQYEAKTAVLDFLPTVQGQVSGQFAWGRNIDPETNTYNTITTFNNYYTIEASMSLFDGGQTINAFRRAKNARRQSQTALQKAADDKALAVMTKFVDAIYNKKSVAIAEAKLADSRALLHKTRRLFELGEKSRPDVAQMESQVAEDEYNLLHQQNQARLTLIALKSEMNWPISDTLVLGSTDGFKPFAGAAFVAVRNGMTNESYGYSTADGHEGRPCEAGNAMDWNPNVKIASQKAADLKYAYRIARARLFPTLSLGGGVATNFYRNLSLGSGSAGTFGSQFHNNLGEYVYLSLSIPLFVPDRWRNVRRAKSDWQKAQLDLDDARRKWHDDRAQAIADRDGYQAELLQMQRKVGSDSLAYHLSKRKYEEGMLSTFDLHTAAQSLLQSRIRLLQTQLLLTIKERLVRYYEGGRLW